MEVTREMRCPMQACQSVMAVWQFGDPPITVVSCPACHLDGVLGDDRLLDNTDFSDEVIRGRLKKRADKMEEARKEAANRYTDVNR